MRVDRQLKKQAKKLVELSLEDGRVSEERVGGVLEALRRHPPRRHRRLLTMFLRYIRREIARHHAVVETAAPLSAETIRSLENDLSELAGRPITTDVRDNADLLLGVRVRLADDVYDASASEHLDRFARSIQ